MIIQKIVIAGAGTMGSSMAQIYAEYFDDVVLYNHRQSDERKGKQSAWCIVVYHFYGMLQNL